MIKMQRANGQIDEAIITAFEKAIGMRLPDDYRSFLKEVNGGRPEEYEFMVENWGPVPLNELLGLNVGGRDELLAQYQRMKHQLPHGYLPIGDDPAGNFLCLKISSPNLGQIVLWDHERSTPDENEGENQYVLHHVAHSFSDFIENRLLPI